MDLPRYIDTSSVAGLTPEERMYNRALQAQAKTPFKAELPFKVGNSEVALFSGTNYKVNVSIGQQKSTLLPTEAVLDTGACPNLIDKRYIPLKWRHAIRPQEVSRLRGANNTTLVVEGVILLHVRVGDLCVKVWFGVVPVLVTKVLLGTTYINRFVRGIFPPEQQVVPFHSRPIPLLKPPTASVLLVEPHDGTTSVHHAPAARDDMVRVAKPVRLPPYSECKVLVTCATPGLIMVEPHSTALADKLVMTAYGIMENNPKRPFYVMMSNLSATPVWIQKHWQIAVATPTPVAIIECPEFGPRDEEPEPVMPIDVPEDGAQSKKGEESSTSKDEERKPIPVPKSQAPVRSTIMEKKINWDEQLAREAPKSVDWREKIRLGKSFAARALPRHVVRGSGPHQGDGAQD